MRYVYYGSMDPQWTTRTEERWRYVSSKLKDLGITIEALYYTQGEFDFIEVVEAPDAVAALAYSIWFAREGFGRIRTMPAFTRDEMIAAVDKV